AAKDYGELKVVDDLAQLVKRLARSLRKAAPDNDLSEKALGYLIREAALRLDEQALELASLRETLTECRYWIDETYENRSVFKEPPKMNVFECA
nr:hypothetical protein [Candidatus Moranbacteria bacterium]